MKLIFDYQAVIFDLDGVLADTEPRIFRLHQDTIRAYGPVLTGDDYLIMRGIDYNDTAQYLIERYGIPESIPDLAEILRSSVIDNIHSVIEPIPGSSELVIAFSQNGIGLGLASNSACEYVRRAIRYLGLADYFPQPVCRDDVVLGKPSPDPYLEACRRVNADPTRSLAIEDSPVGMRSALAAGMDCALVNANPPSDLPPPVTHFTNMRQLLSAVQAAGKL